MANGLLIQQDPGLKRKHELAQAMASQSLSGPVQSPWEAIAKLGTAYLSKRTMDGVEKQQKDRESNAYAKLAEALSPVVEGGKTRSRTSDEVSQMLASNPDTAPYALQMRLANVPKAGEGFTLGPGQKRYGGDGKVIASGPAKNAPAGYRWNEFDELVPIPGGPADKKKPIPTAALKLQQEELDAIGIAANISTDLGAITNQIEEGKLDFGLVSNLANKAKNFVGKSDEGSRNLATFQATLEKLRNDSLRLNKGMQTEGDAQRAWDELVSNINDKELVKQRLGEIQKINDRAVNMRKMNIESIRSNFGAEPLDTTGYTTQPAVVGSPKPQAQGWSIKKK